MKSIELILVIITMFLLFTAGNLLLKGMFDEIKEFCDANPNVTIRGDAEINCTEFGYF